MSETSPANPDPPAAGSDDSLLALQAVQIALDRRDNGGDADAARDATTEPASRPVLRVQARAVELVVKDQMPTPTPPVTPVPPVTPQPPARQAITDPGKSGP